MYVILSYDVDANRTQIFKKISERFLHRIQNSVFEGHITESKLIQLSSNIKENLKDNESVLIWKLESEKNLKKLVYGKIEKYIFL